MPQSSLPSGGPSRSAAPKLRAPSRAVLSRRGCHIRDHRVAFVSPNDDAVLYVRRRDAVFDRLLSVVIFPSVSMVRTT